MDVAQSIQRAMLRAEWQQVSVQAVIRAAQSLQAQCAGDLKRWIELLEVCAQLQKRAQELAKRLEGASCGPG